MVLKSIIKKFIKCLLQLISKDYLFEYWQIINNEEKTLSKIASFYSEFISEQTKIIDVGANIGNYSKVFLNYGATVIGVEPQRYCQKILHKRFNSISKFKLIPYASGAFQGQADIHLSKSHTIASMSKKWIDGVSKSNRFKNENWDKTENINITTLDKIIAQNFIPDYIKIDVEGYESEVLKGLSIPIKTISFEITLPELKESTIACINEINRLGNYKYAIPSETKIIEIKSWKTHSEIINEIEELCHNKKEIS